MGRPAGLLRAFQRSERQGQAAARSNLSVTLVRRARCTTVAAGRVHRLRVPSGAARDEPSNVAFRNNFGVFRGEVEEVRLVRTRIANRFSDSLRYRMIWSNVSFSRRSGEINSSNIAKVRLSRKSETSRQHERARTKQQPPASNAMGDKTRPSRSNPRWQTPSRFSSRASRRNRVGLQQ